MTTEWTPRQIAALKEVWPDPTVSPDQIRSRVGRSIQSCRHKAYRLGIKRPYVPAPKHSDFTDKKPGALMTEREIAALYAGRTYG